MNGMVIETHDGMLDSTIRKMDKGSRANILGSDGTEWSTVAYYNTEAARDRAWAMLENAIATGVRLFRFPTDAEVEGEEE